MVRVLWVLPFGCRRVPLALSNLAARAQMHQPDDLLALLQP